MMFKIANGEAGDFSLWTAPAWPLIHVQFSKTKEFLFGEKQKGVELGIKLSYKENFEKGFAQGIQEGWELVRQVFRLYMDGKSPDEIAEACQLTEDKVREILEGILEG